MGRIAKKYNLCAFGKKYETVNRALLFSLNEIKQYSVGASTVLRPENTKIYKLQLNLL